MNRQVDHKKYPSSARKHRRQAYGVQHGARPWKWFGTGLLGGVFLSGLAWLSLQTPTGEPLSEPLSEPSSEPSGEPPASSADEDGAGDLRFDFYTLLPEQKFDVGVDQDAASAARNNPAISQFLLQAGSFKQAADADRRRAELLLLGLSTHVSEVNGDNGRWYRVYIGPFASRSLLNKARSLTAQQGIDTLLLKRPAPG